MLPDLPCSRAVPWRPRGIAAPPGTLPLRTFAPLTERRSSSRRGGRSPGTGRAPTAGSTVATRRRSPRPTLRVLPGVPLPCRVTVATTFPRGGLPRRAGTAGRGAGRARALATRTRLPRAPRLVRLLILHARHATSAARWTCACATIAPVRTPKSPAPRAPERLRIPPPAPRARRRATLDRCISRSLNGSLSTAARFPGANPARRRGPSSSAKS